MPSFSQAISFLAAFALTSDITTTTTVVCTNDFKFTTRRETRKFSKKNEAPRGCTYHNFVGSSKYRNCQKIETEIKIGCGDEDADDNTRMCKVTEHNWNHEKKEDNTDAAAANTACVVHGLFDPKTHITTDSATGFCHLKFLPLFDSCDVDANGSPSGVFGMKAEIHNNRNTDNDDNSGLLLRFSHTGGTDYYNEDDPRETVPLHDIIPVERKLEEDDTTCHPPAACKKFNGLSCDTKHGKYASGCTDEKGNFTALGSTKTQPFQTCFGWGGPTGNNRCWANSFHIGDGKSFGGYYPCVPRDVSYDGKTFKHWYVANPLPGGSCGPPCDYGFNEMTLYPLHKIGEEYDCYSYTTGGCRY